jgi:DNA-binding NtrC family response regulator
MQPMPTQHILIVDDETNLALSLARALQFISKHCEVSVVYSGEEALEIVKTHPVDLLITDLRLPGINGLELIRRMQISAPQLQSILITAYGNDKIKEEARNLAVYRCFDKPFLLEKLLNTTREVLATENGQRKLGRT